jgi:RNA polymerase sigma-70 factor (ECF subfamily)
MRRRRWQDVSLQEMLAPYEESGREMFSDPSPTPEEQAGKTEMLGAVRRMIEEELTEKQRQAMLAVMAGGMPLEEVAQRQGTSRGALYKLLHDARRKIKKRMIEEGFSPQDVLDTLDKG